jgi:IS605 OrfB family transposase
MSDIILFMKQVLTIVCKLNPSKEVVKKIDTTLEMFTAACNYANLQKKASKGTHSSRRRCRQLLKRLSGKEKRFQRHINHVISKTIVLDTKKSNSIVAIEDLTGIRQRTNQQPRSKTERRRSNSWAFCQLRIFLEYKGLINGVEILPVSPRYSSQTCHACMHLGLRSGNKFKCTNSGCSWHGDADENASYNLSIIGGVVSLLRGSDCLSCELNQDNSGLLKHSTGSVGRKLRRSSAE